MGGGSCAGLPAKVYQAAPAPTAKFC